MNSSICIALSLLLFPAFAFSDTVYKSTDASGRVRYSSSPPSKDAKPAKLPEIMRGEVKLVEQKLVSCDKHGGINCQAGSDSDGSVICFDGFKGASARYRFTCNAPKLEVADISEVGVEGGFSVFIRNTKSVDAQKTMVTVRANDGLLKLFGPDEIKAYGTAEFQYTPSSKDKVITKPGFADITISCSNCPA